MSLNETDFMRPKLDLFKAEYEKSNQDLSLLRTYVDNLERYLGYLWGNLTDVYEQLYNATDMEEVRSSLREEYEGLLDIKLD